MTKLFDFYADLKERVEESASEYEPSEASKGQAFIDHVLSQMASRDLLDEYNLVYLDKPKHVVHAAGKSSDDAVLYLVAGSYAETAKPETLRKADVDELRTRLMNFLKGAVKGFHDKLPPGEARDLALSICSEKENFTKAKLIFVFDRIGKDYRYDVENIEGLDIATEFWDLERIATDLSPDRPVEPITVALQDYNAEVFVLDGGGVRGVYKTYLAVMPGDLIARIYAEHGSRLLERNVRSFLQLRTTVNKNIRETIVGEPEMFLTYNNGLSSTASKVEVEKTPAGSLLKRLVDFQIVNGGQTTASLYRATVKDKADLSRVRVQVKLTEVLSAEKMDEIVPRISRCSNSQNAVQEADFSANDPYHRILEKLSRRLTVPDPTGGKKATYWFYERARGQYEVEKSKAATASTKRQFKERYPPRQRFDKIAVAKAINTWDFQAPDDVSLGGQKNFAEFTKRLANGEISKEPDASYFRQLVCKTILFRAMDDIVRTRMEPGYKANIVTYTLAWLSLAVKGRLPYGFIWKEQRLPLELTEQLHHMALAVRAHLVAPEDTSNVTEWAKTAKCWDKLQKAPLPIRDDDFHTVYERILTEDPGLPIGDTPGQADALRIGDVSLESWISLRSSPYLEKRSRTVIDLVVQSLRRRKLPKPKILQAALKAHERAAQRGFR